MGKNKGNSGQKSDPQKSDGKRKKKGDSGILGMGLAAGGAIALLAVGLQLAGVPILSPQSMLVPEPPLDAPSKQTSDLKLPTREPKRKPPKKRELKSIEPGCVDDDENCEQWARTGECDNNQQFMHSKCRASCHLCKGGKPEPKKAGACEDSNDNCATWAAIGECQSNPGYMLGQCPGDATSQTPDTPSSGSRRTVSLPCPGIVRRGLPSLPCQLEP